jgi:hypothetical protein
MKNILMLLPFAFLIYACGDGSTQAGQGTGDQRFHTTQPSLLYFKNMRSTQYVMEEQAQSRIELYRHKKFGEEESLPPVFPVIANHWLQDEAYLFLQTQPGLFTPLTLATDSTGSEPLSLESPKPAQQYELAMQLYDGLKDQKQWYVKQQDGQFTPLYQEGEEKTAFLLTLRDYLKLTEVN